jgi:hypothetical protein
MNNYLSLILFTPLIGALVMLFVSKQNENAIRWIANITALLGYSKPAGERGNLLEGKPIQALNQPLPFSMKTRNGLSLFLLVAAFSSAARPITGPNTNAAIRSSNRTRFGYFIADLPSTNKIVTSNDRTTGLLMGSVQIITNRFPTQDYFNG